MNDVELYWNEDHTEYAVLVSHGFGAGWSTWNRWPELAYDKRIVEWFLGNVLNDRKSFYDAFHSEDGNEREAAVLDFLHSIGYHGYICLLGFASCDIEWVRRGTMWRIEEYDGAEKIVYQNDFNWNCF